MPGVDKKRPAVVLDASVAAAWYLPDEHSDWAEELLSQILSGRVQAWVPDLWFWECSNIAVQAVRRQRLKALDAKRALDILDAVPVQVANTETLEEILPAIHLAMEAGLTTHDAGYLYLAKKQKIALASFDKALVRAAQQLKITLWTPVAQ